MKTEQDKERDQEKDKESVRSLPGSDQPTAGGGVGLEGGDVGPALTDEERKDRKTRIKKRKKKEKKKEDND